MKCVLFLPLVGLALCLACDHPRESAHRSASSPRPVENMALEPKLVSLKVAGMTCPSGCYPSVRSAIAKQEGVLGVELAPQQKEDVIDNPTVYVKYRGELDLEATLQAIARAGFEAEALSN
jgi:copper chaperone CopZ